jgi:cation-transporting ATPase 13A3/4/5
MFEIMIAQLLSPFFMFQYFSVILWCYENYIAFSMVILAITIIAIYTNTAEQNFNLKRLREMAGRTTKVNVLNNQGTVELDDSELTPGCRFIVQDSTVLPCDAVLIRGRAVVDESMLTGESAPVSKVPFNLSERQEIDSEIDPLKHSGHILFSGSKVKKVTPDAIAVVYRTAFRSAKGKLIASLLETKEDSLGFFSDALYVVGFMFLLASFLYVWASTYLKRLGASDSLIVLKWLDAITIAVPPALTTCLIVATSIAIKRLNLNNIFVSESSRVNWAGTVEVACFDKVSEYRYKCFVAHRIILVVNY